MDRENTIVYSLLEVADDSFRQPNTSTPSALPRETTTGERGNERQRFLESIDFDGFSPLSAGTAARKMKTEASRRTMPELPPPGAQSVAKKVPMKPNKFDGTGSLESFLAQFDVCAPDPRTGRAGDTGQVGPWF